MSITSTLVTDDWRYIDIGDFGDATEDLIKKGLSGTVTFTPIGLSGTSVDDTPEDWYIVARPRTARYTLGRLVGGDGVKGIRLVSSVDGTPVVWRVERDLRWNGQAIPGIDPVTVVFAGEANHLPEMAPVSADSGTSITEAIVAVAQLIAAAQGAAGRAESAATDAVDASGDARQARADTLAARQDAQDAATRAQQGADRVGSAEAVLDAATHAGQSAADADAAAVRAETAATDAEGVATAAATTAATAAVAHVVGTAPENLDTLGEIADKLADQDDVAAALTTQIAGKLDRSTSPGRVYGTGLQGQQGMYRIASSTDLANSLLQRDENGRARGIKIAPSFDDEAASKGYVDTAVSGVVATASDAASVAAAAQAAASAALPASKIQVVTAMPASPVAGTFYYVTGA